MESLFRTTQPTRSGAPVPPDPENKRVWASLVKGKAAVLAEVAAEMERRDPQRIKTRLALSDGERALQILVDQTLHVTLILDLLHVLEKLWKAAYVFHPEGSPEAESWVKKASGENSSGASRSARQGLSAECDQAPLARFQTQNFVGGGGLLLPKSASDALSPIPRPGLADRQWPSRRCLQEPDQRSHGTIGHALDGGDG